MFGAPVFFGIPFTINCRCVMNVEADIKIIMIIATTLTMLSELPKNVCEIGAPKIVAAPALETSAAVKTPRGTF